MILLWTAAYALAFLVGLGYTAYLFPGQTLPHLGFSVFCLWMFGVFLLSTLLLAASLTKNTFGALLLLCLVLGGLLLANIFPDWQASIP
jgi:ABC-2 type transport system permease protein